VNTTSASTKNKCVAWWWGGDEVPQHVTLAVHGVRSLPATATAGTPRPASWRPPPGRSAFVGGVVVHDGHSEVQWREAGAWLWVALLVSAVAPGGYVLAAAAGRRPATIR
jgi:hypothetical protein